MQYGELFRFKFNWTKDTWVALLLGGLVVGLSFTLQAFQAKTHINAMLSFIVLDLLMKGIIGFTIPLFYILVVRNKSLALFGITKKRWKISLLLGLLFASLLLIQFILEPGNKGKEILIRSNVFIPVFYIFVAGIFEMTFIYGFLRRIFDESFGVIPGILLTALFYSFHHAGFQPEFGKLILVGILYAGVYRITNNLLIVFPFFWGVGAVWDVLVHFGTVELMGISTFLKGISTLLIMIISAILIHFKFKWFSKE